MSGHSIYWGKRAPTNPEPKEDKAFAAYRREKERADRKKENPTFRTRAKAQTYLERKGWIKTSHTLYRNRWGKTVEITQPTRNNWHLVFSS